VAGSTNRNTSVQDSVIEDKVSFYVKHQQPEFSQTQGPFLFHISRSSTKQFNSYLAWSQSGNCLVMGGGLDITRNHNSAITCKGKKGKVIPVL